MCSLFQRPVSWHPTLLGWASPCVSRCVCVCVQVHLGQCECYGPISGLGRDGGGRRRRRRRDDGKMRRRNNKHDRKGRIQGHLPCIPSPTALKPGKRKRRLRGRLRGRTLPATPPLVQPSRQSALCLSSALTPSSPPLHHVTMSTWGNWPSLGTG